MFLSVFSQTDLCFCVFLSPGAYQILAVGMFLFACAQTLDTGIDKGGFAIGKQRMRCMSDFVNQFVLS